jgi:glucose-6-phosphate dehydrogenase assembly protein OpcA
MPKGRSTSRSTSAERELALHRHLMRFGEEEAATTPVWEQRGTTVAAIEAQLARLWGAAESAGGDGEAQVTERGLRHPRASVLNLIVTVPDSEAAGRVVHALMRLGLRHPSRAIILVADHTALGRPLDARISTHCDVVPGSRDKRICYEEVVLVVRGEPAEHLSGVVAPILIHDLPTFVWWPGDPPFAHPVFDQLVDLSSRLLVDTSDFDDLLVGMRRLASLRHRSGVGDLTWVRLGAWQERIAQFFDGPRFRRYLPNLNRMVLRYAVPTRPGRRRRRADVDAVQSEVAAPMAEATLLAGWIASRLDWKRYRTVQPLTRGAMRLELEGTYGMVDLRIEPDRTNRMVPGELTSVRLRAHGETGAAEFIIDRTGDEATVATNADGMTALLRRITMETPSEAELLSALLGGPRRDPVYEAALRAAVVFLASASEGSAAVEAAAAPLGTAPASPVQELGG